MFSVHTKMQSQRFQILPVRRVFSKSSVFSGQFLQIGVDGGPNRRNKAAFSNSPA